MKNKYSKTALTLAIIFATILIAELVFAKFFPGWTFKTASLVTGNKLLSYLSFWGLIYCVILVFKPAFSASIALGILFSFILGISSCLTIYPIDTTTQPVDQQTIEAYPDGKKLIVRQYKNAKTNAEIQDTVLVKDVFLFRYIYLQK